MKSAPRFGIGLAGAMLALSLAGCTVGGPSPAASSSQSSTPTPAPTEAETQSKAEACIILSTALTTLSSEMNASMQGLQTDPAGAAAQLQDTIATFEAALAEVTNEEMLALGQKATASLHEMADLFVVLVADPSDPSGLLEIAGTVQADLLAIGTACAP